MQTAAGNLVDYRGTSGVNNTRQLKSVLLYLHFLKYLELIMKSLTSCAVAVFLTLSILSVAEGQDFQVLHSFCGGTADGSSPCWSGVIADGSTLYGTTCSGGANNRGIIYSIDTDGSNFDIVWSFGASSNEASPEGGLTIADSTLYGMTHGYGSSGYGTIFKIDTNGNGYSVLHSFSGSGVSCPRDQLPIISDSTMYGAASAGVFTIDTSGYGFNILRSFSGGSDGKNVNSLILVESTLYGTTYWGGDASGSSGHGVLFKLNTDGTGFQVMHTFGDTGDGARPAGNLVLVDSTLYGTTTGGGIDDGGTIYKINLDNTGYTTLHNFTTSEGVCPIGGLTLIGSTLYGTTCSGGNDNNGTIFQCSIDGNGFDVLHAFNGSDGKKSRSTLTAVGNTLYGTTNSGGSSGYGVVFALTVPEPSTITLLFVGAIGMLGYAWRRRGIYNH